MENTTDIARTRNRDIHARLEATIRRDLQAMGANASCIGGYLASQNTHGVLRPSAPEWLQRSALETWSRELSALQRPELAGGLGRDSKA